MVKLPLEWILKAYNYGVHLLRICVCPRRQTRLTAVILLATLT